jgi:pimeloyl-ACP methyl ester carboxylesterase
MPGYAPSSLEGPFDVSSLARRMLLLIDELSPSEPIRIVGHDWGAILTQLLTAQRPERFRASAALSVPHMLAFEANIERYPRQLLKSGYMAFFQIPGLSDRALELGNYRLIERLWAGWSPGFDPGDAYFAELKLCLRSSMPAPLKYYRGLKSPKAIREFRATVGAGPIVVPTLYLHGERDGCIGPELADGQEQYYSALFEIVKLADAGHFLHLERPAEVNAAIPRWFEAH